MIGLRVGLRGGVRVGLAAGVSADRLGGSGDPMAGVTKDATSGKYVPSTSGEWTTAMAAAGLSAIGNPDYLYLCQEASGNLAATIGSQALTAFNSPLYQQTVAGWSRFFVGGADGTVGQRFSSTAGFPAPSGQAYFVLNYHAITANPAANRITCIVGTSVSESLSILSTGKLRCSSGASNADAPSNTQGTTVHPLHLYSDPTGNLTEGGDDQDILAPTHTDGGTAGFYLGATGAVAGWRTGMAAVWTTNATMFATRANRKVLLQTLAWTIPWS